MVTSKVFKSIVALATVLFVSTMPLQAQNPENDQILKSIPDNTLFCIRINNFTSSLGQMDKFLTGVSPVGVSMFLQAQLTQLLGSQQLEGLNMAGNFAAFGAPMPNQDPGGDLVSNIFTGVLAPVTNYKEFLNGISSKTPVDSNGIVKVLSLGNPVLLVTEYHGFALMTWPADYNKLVTFRKMMGIGTSAGATEAPLVNALGSPEAKQAVSEPFWIYANIQQVSKTFSPVISAGLEQLKTALGSIPSTSTGISSANLQDIMKIYVNIIEKVLKEVKSVSLSINPTPTVLNMTKMVATVPGTEMAKMFAANPSSEKNNLFPYLEDGAMMNFAFFMNSPLLRQAVDLQVDLLAMMSGESTNSDNLQKIKTISENMIETIKGPAAYTFSMDAKMKPPFKGSYIIAEKDEKKFQQLINESTQLMNNMDIMNIYKKMGLDISFTVNRNVETYKGISIDSAKLAMKFTDTNTPEAKMIETMYGSGFEYRWALVNGLFAATIGTDADAAIHKLIDRIQAGGEKQIASEIKTAMSLVPEPEEADFFLTMNFLRLFKLGANMASSMAPLPAIPSINIESSNNLVIDGKANNGTMTVHIAVPKEHIEEIMRAFMTLQQEMLKRQQSTPAGGS